MSSRIIYQFSNLIENSYQESENKGIIWKIDRYSTHDGPGVRTLIFLKGCPLRCQWCSNVEGQVISPDLVFIVQRCIGCGICVSECPYHALYLEAPINEARHIVQIDRNKCDLCQLCIMKCPTNALEVWGVSYSISELLTILERDRYVHSMTGGGVTITGGEPLFQGEFVLKLAETCKSLGIHTAIETCAYVKKDLFQAILAQVDCIYIDLKHMNPKKHRRLTGKDNSIILENIRIASYTMNMSGKTLVIRVPIIPEVNDDKENIEATVNFLNSLPFLTGVELLPYHCYGVHKYGLVGRTYNMQKIKPPTKRKIEGLKKIFRLNSLKILN